MDGSGEKDIKRASDFVKVIQSMIDVNSDRLEGLRTQCATSAELTQQEIRTLEGKLIKLFSEQLAIKAQCNGEQTPQFQNTPSLTQWLRVVGLSPDSVEAVCQKITGVEALKEKSDHELKALLSNAREEEVHRLCRAMHILKKYTDLLLRGENTGSDMALHWDSWDRHHTKASPRPSRAPLHLEKANTPVKLSVSSIEPPPLTKSRSHESQLQKNNDDFRDTSQSLTSVEPVSPPISEPHLHHHDDLSNHASQTSSSSSGAMRSPRAGTTARSMAHVIKHRFTKHFNMISSCDFCEKMLFGAGLKCCECKYKCHKECESKVPLSCGLPHGYVIAFKEHIQKDGTYNPQPSPIRSVLAALTHRKKHEDRSGEASPSSRGSSAPASPAPPTSHASTSSHFHFPDVASSESSTKTVVNELTSSRRSADSSRTGSQSGSASTSSTHGDSLDDPRWPRQNSLSMKEWAIPYDELRLLEVVGTGRFGTVYRGLWHGAVAVKLLNVHHDNAALQAFKQEVATFRKTRHENLVLFMGACMKPPKLAIVTSLCRGNTLYTLIHLRRDKFNANKCIVVAQQISQGMGYLHARGIIHKDLKTKNIFLENNKVVITDFGLFSVTKLCFSNNGLADRLGIPAGWLCYLAPELLRSLRVHNDHNELPFTTDTDVYAFGTVWYELLTGEWPFRGQPPEAVIWQVGRGAKQPLRDLNVSREVKDILLMCWSYNPSERPDFSRLRTLLDRLPRKRLARSPSHPLHLSRSAESVF